MWLRFAEMAAVDASILTCVVALDGAAVSMTGVLDAAPGPGSNDDKCVYLAAMDTINCRINAIQTLFMVVCAS